MGQDTELGLAEVAARTYSILQTCFGKEDLLSLKASHSKEARFDLEQFLKNWHFYESPDSLLLSALGPRFSQSRESIESERDHRAPLFVASAYRFYEEIVNEENEGRALVRLAAYPHHMILRELFHGHQVSAHRLDNYVKRTAGQPSEVRSTLAGIRGCVEKKLTEPGNGSSSPSQDTFNPGMYVTVLFDSLAKLDKLP